MSRPATTDSSDDAVGEHQPVAPVGELAGQVAVAGDDRPTAGGSRRTRCWPPGSGWRTWRTGGRSTATMPSPNTAAAMSDRIVSSSSTSVGLRWWASTEMPKKQRSPGSRPSTTSVRGGVARLRAAGRRARRWRWPRRRTGRRRRTRTPACRMNSDAPVSERAVVGQLVAAPPRWRGSAPRSPKNDLVQAVHEQGAEADDVDVGRDGEERRRTPSRPRRLASIISSDEATRQSSTRYGRSELGTPR